MKTKTLPAVLLTGTLLVAAFSAHAAVITSFETSEGFTANSRTNTAGWSFANNSNVRVSVGTPTEPALQGSLSLYTKGSGSTVNAWNYSLVPAAQKLNSYSFNSITDNDTFISAQYQVNWVNVVLWDDTTNAVRSISLYTSFGNTSGDKYRIWYSKDNGSGASTQAFKEVNKVDYVFTDWNKVSADFDFAAGTYNLSLNNTVLVSNILLPTIWDVSAVVGTQLNSPTTGYTTYYDVVSIVPEPSSAALLGLAGIGLLSVGFRRKASRLA